MKKKLFLSLLTILMITSCGGTKTSTSEKPSEEETTIAPTVSPTEEETIDPTLDPTEEITSDSLETTTDNPTDTPTEHVIEYDKSLNAKQINEIGQKYSDLVNEYGVYESDYRVEIKLQLVSIFDAITTKAAYGDRYKLIMSDGTDIIPVKVNFDTYKNMKKYIDDRQSYLVKGHISLYNGVTEITAEAKVQYLKDDVMNIEYEKLSRNAEILDIYNYIDSMKVNIKGCGIGELVSVNAKCLARDINNTNMIFANGDTLIDIHGSDKVTNGIYKDRSYKITGIITMYNYKPGLEFVSCASLSDDIKIDFSSIETVTASSRYNLNYKVDTKYNYLEYTNSFLKPVKVIGYANTYFKDSLYESIVIEDTYNDYKYDTITNAINAKTLFLANENYKNMNNTSYKSCPLYEQVDLGSKIEFTLLPYLWNTGKYPMMYCFDYKII